MNMKLNKLIIMSGALLGTACASSPKLNYPEAVKEDVTDEYFGTVV